MSEPFSPSLQSGTRGHSHVNHYPACYHGPRAGSASDHGRSWRRQNLRAYSTCPLSAVCVSGGAIGHRLDDLHTQGRGRAEAAAPGGVLPAADEIP